MGTEKNGHSVEYAYYEASSLERSLWHMLLGQYFLCTFPFATELSESSFGNKGRFGRNLRCIVTVQRSSRWYLAIGTAIYICVLHTFFRSCFFCYIFVFFYLFPSMECDGPSESSPEKAGVSDWRFNTLSGSHLQSQVTVWNSNEWSDALVCIVIGSW